MSNYVQDPNNSKKVIPGPKPANAYDRTQIQSACSMSKTPHQVLVVNGDGSNDTIGFFFGSSASFAEKNTVEGNVSIASGILTASTHYQTFGKGLSAGTILDINPLAWSGSAAMEVTFIYRSGLSGGRR
tara:strand:- start:49 stop:435 length:387 start_codon:yes stop_codon:yes gene_type:complete